VFLSIDSTVSILRLIFCCGRVPAAEIQRSVTKLLSLNLVAINAMFTFLFLKQKLHGLV